MYYQHSYKKENNFKSYVNWPWTFNFPDNSKTTDPHRGFPDTQTPSGFLNTMSNLSNFPMLQGRTAQQNRASAHMTSTSIVYSRTIAEKRSSHVNNIFENRFSWRILKEKNNLWSLMWCFIVIYSKKQD